MDSMNCEFDELKEKELLNFIQLHYGLEVFNPGLDRTKGLFRPFIVKSRENNLKVTIIAGTNGKGQTAHTLGYFLECAKKSYALWTSPHILSLRERFCFDGKNVSYDELWSEIQKSHSDIQRQGNLVISFYEFLFYVFLRLSIKRPIKHLLLEVGLGGRLDAVNHFDADLTCITSISRDHQAILGNRYDLILNEKIAVTRRDKILLTQFRSKYLNELTEIYCQKNQIQWKRLIPPEGRNYFEENKRMAKALFSELVQGEHPSIEESIPHFKGRREVMTFQGNNLIFIGAHNTDGVRSMIDLFKSEGAALGPQDCLISFSKRSNQEIEVMLKTIVGHFGDSAKLNLTFFKHPKAIDQAALLEVAEKFNKINKGMLDFVAEWKTYLIQSKNRTILVCGSYYFIGEVQHFIITHPEL